MSKTNSLMAALKDAQVEEEEAPPVKPKRATSRSSGTSKSTGKKQKPEQKAFDVVKNEEPEEKVDVQYLLERKITSRDRGTQLSKLWTV